MSRFFRSALFPLIVIVLLVYLASQTLLPRSDDGPQTTLSELITTVETNPDSIEEVLFKPKGQEIEVTYADGEKAKLDYPSHDAQFQLQQALEQNDVAFDSKGTGSSAWWSFLTYLLPFLLFFGFWIFLMNQVQVLDAYDLVLRALPHVYVAMPDEAAKAVPLLERALALEADYAGAHGLLAWCHQFLFIRAGFTESDRIAAIRHARAAVTCGRDDATAMALGAFVIGLVGSMIALPPAKHSSGRWR